MIGSSVVHAVRRWVEESSVRHQLEELSDRELADIGLSRGDIEAVAHGRFKRPGRA